jgi:hypothetical protein
MGFKFDYIGSIKNSTNNTIESCEENQDAKIRFITYSFADNAGNTRYGLYAETLRGKKIVNVYYKNAERRDEGLELILKSAVDRKDMMDKRKRERREFKTDAQLGDIFVYSWGWEQTNKNFFQIININGNTLTFKEISQESSPNQNGGSYMSDYVLPVPNQFIDSQFYSQDKEGKNLGYLKKRMTSKDYINMEFGAMFKWDGKPEYVSWYA